MDDERVTIGERITVNQLIAKNLARERNSLGLTQDELLERMRPYLGDWSKQRLSAAERAGDDPVGRRAFEIDEVIGFALTFGLPLTAFFAAPPNIKALHTLPPEHTVDENGVEHYRWNSPPVDPIDLLKLVTGPQARESADVIAARLRALADQIQAYQQ